jgi:membrane fusion protein (multidrug efflux system)
VRWTVKTGLFAKRSAVGTFSAGPRAALALGLSALLVFAGCAEPTAQAEETHVFDATTVVRQDTEIVHEYVCQIRAIRHIEVRALERGYLRDIFVDEGQSVEHGQHLFQIAPVVYQAELARSSAEMAAAEVEYQNTRRLREGNVVSAQELALAQANLERAAAQRSLAQAHLRFTSLDAPFDGIIGRLMVRPGSLLEEGDLLTVLADNSEMWVYFNVSESQYLAYRAEHALGEPVPVQLRMANGQLFDQPGVIQTIEADFNNETGTIAFRAGFANPTGLLRHGETGEILMTTVLPHVLVVPQGRHVSGARQDVRVRHRRGRRGARPGDPRRRRGPAPLGGRERPRGGRPRARRWPAPCARRRHGGATRSPDGRDPRRAPRPASPLTRGDQRAVSVTRKPPVLSP